MSVPYCNHILPNGNQCHTKASNGNAKCWRHQPKPAQIPLQQPQVNPQIAASQKLYNIQRAYGEKMWKDSENDEIIKLTKKIERIKNKIAPGIYLCEYAVRKGHADIDFNDNDDGAYIDSWCSSKPYILNELSTYDDDYDYGEAGKDDDSDEDISEDENEIDIDEEYLDDSDGQFRKIRNKLSKEQIKIIRASHGRIPKPGKPSTVLLINEKVEVKLPDIFTLCWIPGCKNSVKPSGYFVACEKHAPHYKEVTIEPIREKRIKLLKAIVNNLRKLEQEEPPKEIQIECSYPDDEDGDYIDHKIFVDRISCKKLQ